MSNSIVLLNEIQKLLNSSKTSSMSSSSKACDLFEVYILGLILKAAKNEGATIEYEDVNGNSSSSLIFRTSPAQIYWKNKTYCHAIIKFPNKPLLEAHVGIYVSGKSKVLHECDVAVLYRDEGITCRRQSVTPRYSKLILAVECKFYTNSIPLSQARAFIGLSTDIGTSNCFFVVNTNSPSAEKLLAHNPSRRNNWEHKIVPSSQNEVTRLTSSFQNYFKNFKAAK